MAGSLLPSLFIIFILILIFIIIIIITILSRAAGAGCGPKLPPTSGEERSGAEHAGLAAGPAPAPLSPAMRRPPGAAGNAARRGGTGGDRSRAGGGGRGEERRVGSGGLRGELLPAWLASERVAKTLSRVPALVLGVLPQAPLARGWGL